MNLAPVLLAWNLARRQAALGALRVSPALTMRANRQLATWTPGTDPEPAYVDVGTGMVAMIWQGHETAAQVAQAILAAPYHRATILGGYTAEGIAEATVGSWHAVLAIFGGSEAHRPPFVLWLPPQVPAAWTADESPSPFGVPVGTLMGWPVLIRNTNAAGQVKGAEIVGPSGPVATYLDEAFDGSWDAVIAPKAPLGAGTYTLRFWWVSQTASGRQTARLVTRTFQVAKG